MIARVLGVSASSTDAGVMSWESSDTSAKTGRPPTQVTQLAEARQGLEIACLEEGAYRKGYIDKEQLALIIQDTPKSSYRDYLELVLADSF